MWQKRILDAKLTDNILVLHALLGCDTTPRVFGIGKRVAIKTFQNCKAFRQCIKVLTDGCDASNRHKLIRAGQQALVI